MLLLFHFKVDTLKWFVVLSGLHDACATSSDIRLGPASALTVDINGGDLLGSLGLIVICFIGRFHVEILIKAAIILNR